MHPIFGQPGRLVTYLAASLLVALVVVTVPVRQGLGWLEAFAFTLPICLVYSFVCLSAYYVCLAAPLRTSTITRVLATAGLAATLASAIWLALGRAWYAVLELLPLGFDAARYSQLIGFLFPAGVLLFLLSLAVHYALVAFEAAREAERRQLEAEVLARDAQLTALRAQLDPHFLYNSLNSINALTSSDPAGARRMCVMLGDFLRQTLALGSRSWIPLSEELALADRFLDIEQVRFGDRLRVERHTDATAAGCPVPPLLLQPLVENAVTHGIAHLLDGGVIRMDVSRRDGAVSIAIENPRDSDERPSSTGVGLQNVRRRLATIFGDAGRIDTTTEPDRFRVELTVPYSTHG